ncbi:MAG TPA: tyrosine-type recombinase/integrase [Kofleriaceae bacterium]|jgi:integrase
MFASSGEGIRALERGVWSVRVNRVDARTGKPKNRKATVRGSRADAVRKRDELRGELALATAVRARLRLRSYAEAWLARRSSRIKPSTARKYGYALKHAFELLGDFFVDTIAPSDIEVYVAARLAAGAAGNTVLNELRVLRVIARDSVADGLATRYWCDRVRSPAVARYDDDRPNLLTPAQAERVVAHVPQQWFAFLLFILSTGLRFGEASALQWEDVDVDAGVAKIRRNNDRGTLRDSTKNQSSKRTVPMLPEVLVLLERRSSGAVFPSRRGGLHRGSPLRRVLDRACAAAGVPRVTTHGLRRTFNNEGRQVTDVDREVLKATTGHTTDEMVSHYSHVDVAEKARLARAVMTRLHVLGTSSTSTATDSNP